jgi:hypothetical protein
MTVKLHGIDGNFEFNIMRKQREISKYIWTQYHFVYGKFEDEILIFFKWILSWLKG